MPAFFLVKDIHDLITHAKFGDDRLRGLGELRVKFQHFPLTLLVVLTTFSHYRPCERVILAHQHKAAGSLNEGMN